MQPSVEGRPTQMANFTISSDLITTSVMPDHRFFRLSDKQAMIEGELVSYTRSKGWIRSSSSKVAVRHCALTRRGFLLIWMQHTKGFVMRLCDASNVSTATENVRARAGGVRRVCRIKVHFSFGTVNLMFSGETDKVRTWRDGIVAGVENREVVEDTPGTEETQKALQAPAASTAKSGFEWNPVFRNQLRRRLELSSSATAKSLDGNYLQPSIRIIEVDENGDEKKEEQPTVCQDKESRSELPEKVEENEQQKGEWSLFDCPPSASHSSHSLPVMTQHIESLDLDLPSMENLAMKFSALRISEPLGAPHRALSSESFVRPPFGNMILARNTKSSPEVAPLQWKPSTEQTTLSNVNKSVVLYKKNPLALPAPVASEELLKGPRLHFFDIPSSMLTMTSYVAEKNEEREDKTTVYQDEACQSERPRKSGKETALAGVECPLCPFYSSNSIAFVKQHLEAEHLHCAPAPSRLAIPLIPASPANAAPLSASQDALMTHLCLLSATVSFLLLRSASAESVHAALALYNAEVTKILERLPSP